MKKPKQLVTTAFEASWNANEEMIFLGEWCKPYARKNYWSNLNYSVLPYHWDDREKLFRDSKYVSQLIDKFMSLYADKLNVVHDLNWPEKSWRIVLLPWLTLAISCLFDRYHALLNCMENNEHIFYSVVCDKIPSMEFVPLGYPEAFDWLVKNDAYNFFIYSYILKNHLTDIKLAELDDSNINWQGLFNSEVTDSLAQRVRKEIKKTSIKMLGCFRKHNKDILFSETCFSRWDLAKLQLQLKSLPYLDSDNIHESEYRRAIDVELRNSLIINYGDNDFEDLCASILPRLMPQSYLESLKLIRQQSIKYYPKSVKFILTANVHYNEMRKIYSGGQVAKGSKLLSLQHGGHYGTGRFSGLDNIEKNISDCFYVWGWRYPEFKNAKIMPASKLLSLSKKTIKPKVGGDVLLPMLDLPRYSYWMYSIPVAGQLDKYFENINKFSSTIKSSMLEYINCRIPPGNYKFGNDIEGRLGAFSEKVKTSNLGESLYRALKSSRLVVCTYNATVFLETFRANFPTVIFWDPHYFELRNEAKPYYELLRKAGILYYNAEDAAEHVNAIFGDPMVWWMREDVQRVKNTFCERYAFAPPDGLHLWADELKSLAD